MHKTAIARFCQHARALIRSGVPIMEALDIVGETAGNAVVGAAIAEPGAGPRRGVGVGRARHHAVFPPMVVQMIAVGEETGAIDEMLEKIAEFYDPRCRRPSTR